MTGNARIPLVSFLEQKSMVKCTTFMFVVSSDYRTSGVKYGANVTLCEVGGEICLRITYCDNPDYVGRALKKKHNRALSSEHFDDVVELLTKAERKANADRSR